MIICRTLNLRSGGLVVMLGTAAVIAGCGSSGTSSSHTNSASAAGAPAASANAPSGSGARVKLAHGSAGAYLAGPSGRALYLWEADGHGKSACSGACAAAWPPLVSRGKPVALPGVHGKSLATITRPDGSRQVTYQGHPLYYFAGDSAPGQTTGQGSDGFGAKWWLVSPSGAAITGSSPSAGGSSSGGGSGY
jgi:predicted lipoprotein with Yx(FWY)xxD motif